MTFDSRDSFIKHRILLQGQELRLTEVVDAELKKLKKQLTSAIRNNQTNNIRTLQNQINDIINSHYDVIENTFLEDLQELMEYETEFQSEWLNNSVKEAEADGTLTTEVALLSLFLLLQGKSKKITDGQVANVIKEKTAKGQTLGEGILSQRRQLSVILGRVATDAAVNNLSDEVFEANLAAAIGRNQAATKNLLRTFVAAHSNHVAAETYKSNGIEEYEYVAVLDSATTDVCRSENGNIYKWGEGPIPPLHYNCRSTIRPVINKDIGNLSDFLKRNPDTRIKTDEKGNFKKSEDFNMSLNKMKKEEDI